MNYKVINPKPNENAHEKELIQHIPFTKEELSKADLVKTRYDEKLYTITKFVKDNVVEVAPINDEGIPTYSLKRTFFYSEIVELHILDEGDKGNK